jgi:hypothetical protein
MIMPNILVRSQAPQRMFIITFFDPVDGKTSLAAVSFDEYFSCNQKVQKIC